MLSEDERRRLENWARRRSTAQGLALRARIVLACAEGGSNIAVAARLGVSRMSTSRLARESDGADQPWLRSGFRLVATVNRRVSAASLQWRA